MIVAAGASPNTSTKPDGLADSYWNADKGGVQFEPLLKDFRELSAHKAQSDLRRASLPVNADGYKAELPNGYNLPEEFKDYKLDAADPRLPAARALAHELGIDQGGFARLLAIQADYDLGATKRAIAERDAEIGKLGVNGPARVTAVTTFLEARNGGQKSALLAGITSAAGMAELENLVKAVQTQGAASFSGSHRERTPEDGKIEGYDKMSFEQRRAAQMNEKNRQTAA